MPGRGSIVRDWLRQGHVLAYPTFNTDNFPNIALLIGVDNYAAFMYGNNVNKSLFVIPTKVGNLL